MVLKRNWLWYTVSRWHTSAGANHAYYENPGKNYNRRKSYWWWEIYGVMGLFLRNRMWN